MCLNGPFDTPMSTLLYSQHYTHILVFYFPLKVPRNNIAFVMFGMTIKQQVLLLVPCRMFVPMKSRVFMSFIDPTWEK